VVDEEEPVRATLGQPTNGSASRSGRGDAAQLTACLGLIGDSNPLPTHRPSLGDCQRKSKVI
jgi:hypothetical protein